MSILSDAVREIGFLQNQLRDQEMIVNSFLKSNADQMRMVREGLQGSQRGHDQRMLSVLQEAEDALKKSLEQIRQASEALARVQMV